MAWLCPNSCFGSFCCCMNCSWHDCALTAVWFLLLLYELFMSWQCPNSCFGSFCCCMNCSWHDCALTAVWFLLLLYELFMAWQCRNSCFGSFCCCMNCPCHDSALTQYWCLTGPEKFWSINRITQNTQTATVSKSPPPKAAHCVYRKGEAFRDVCLWSAVCDGLVSRCGHNSLEVLCSKLPLNSWSLDRFVNFSLMSWLAKQLSAYPHRHADKYCWLQLHSSARSVVSSVVPVYRI